MSQISFAAVAGWAESGKAPGQRCKRLQAWLEFVNAFWDAGAGVPLVQKLQGRCPHERDARAHI